jgi:hypothetical protein
LNAVLFQIGLSNGNERQKRPAVRAFHFTTWPNRTEHALGELP